MAAPERPSSTRYGERDVYSVAAFLDGTAGYLERVPAIWIEGEVCELRRQAGWGFVYWTLRDLDADVAVPVTMRRHVYDRHRTPLADGDRVHVRGRALLRRDSGKFLVQALSFEPYGLGTLLRDLELLRRRLAAEGLFAPERKRPLPVFPRVVGLVCGRDAAARHDVEQNAARRFPPVRFRVIESAVQGPGAPPELTAALRRLDDDPEVDVIVLARGGGSREDLAAFSDERLLRAIAACGTPVVSAIGHEQDAPLSDLVADLRASTPTDAARRIVPDAAVLLAETSALVARARRVLAARLDREGERLAALAAHPLLRRREAFLERQRADVARAGERLLAAHRRRLERERARVDALAARPILRQPERLVERRRQEVDGWDRRLAAAETGRLAAERGRLDALAAGLRALGPAATLERGYAVVLGPDGHVLRGVDGTSVGERVRVRLASGALRARIEEVERP